MFGTCGATWAQYIVELCVLVDPAGNGLAHRWLCPRDDNCHPISSNRDSWIQMVSFLLGCSSECNGGVYCMRLSTKNWNAIPWNSPFTAVCQAEALSPLHFSFFVGGLWAASGAPSALQDSPLPGSLTLSWSCSLAWGELWLRSTMRFGPNHRL